MPRRRTTLRAALQATGIRRAGGPRSGFRYRRADGAPVSEAARRRIERLRVPPAWREVAISPARDAHLQAIGMDAAGRWQYLYLNAHHVRQSRRKFGRLIAFARALPALRASVRRDLALPDMPRERATAAALVLMSAAALRPGSEVYARENGTFGVATLRSRHLEVSGNEVTLTFRGKHGVRQHHRLRGRRLARLMRELKRRSTRELFEFRDARGVWDLTRRHVNDYIKQAMGARFSARDFRTWFATLVCAAALRSEGVVPPPERRRAIARAIRTTARVLGNTPSVVRVSYVHPAVLEAYRHGRVVAHALDRPEALADRMPVGLHRAERAVLRLIEAA